MSDWFSSEAIAAPIYCLIAIFPQILYFEVSLLIKSDEYRPKLIEGVAVAIIIGLGVFSTWFDWAQNAGERGLGVIVLGPMYIVLCIVMGIVIAHIYKKRNRSIFKR